MEARLSLTAEKACCWISPHVQWFLALRRSLSGLGSRAIWDWNLLNWLTIPKDLLNSNGSLGAAIFVIASPFLGSTCMPSALTVVLKNSTDGLANSHFSSFKVWFASCSLHRVSFRCSSCSLNNLPQTRISSIWHRDPSVSSKTCEIHLWKCLIAELIPNGRRLQQSRLNGVMKAVNLDDSGDKPICQSPEFASSLLNTFTLASWASVWSTQGKGWNSLKMFSFSLVRPTQIRALGTTTIPAHHSVGSSTLEMLCICSIWASSLTFERRGTGTLLGVVRANGLACGFSFMT